jgi:spore germination cell wall hydrolase CwlJ-like protein
MSKKRFSKNRCRTSLLSRGWQNLSLYWHATDKDPLIFVFAISVVVTTFGFFMHTALTRRDDMQNLTCLAFNVYFEARGESLAGQYAVAEVTMNRVVSSRYPDTVCDVVHQKNWDPLRKRYVSAFSWNELDERPSLQDATFRQAWEVADAVYYGRYTPVLAGALHYHAVYIKPSWARSDKPITRIGQHVFYR